MEPNKVASSCDNISLKVILLLLSNHMPSRITVADINKNTIFLIK